MALTKAGQIAEMRKSIVYQGRVLATIGGRSIGVIVASCHYGGNVIRTKYKVSYTRIPAGKIIAICDDLAERLLMSIYLPVGLHHDGFTQVVRDRLT